MNSTASVPMPCPAMSSFSLLLITILVAPNLSLKLGEHCNFVDLCSLGATEDSTCAPGQKFLLRVGCNLWNWSQFLFYCRGKEAWGGSFWSPTPARWWCFSQRGRKSRIATSCRTSPAGFLVRWLPAFWVLNSKVPRRYLAWASWSSPEAQRVWRQGGQ